MATAKEAPKALSKVIDRIEELREELLKVQRELERIEPAEDAARLIARKRK